MWCCQCWDLEGERCHFKGTILCQLATVGLEETKEIVLNAQGLWWWSVWRVRGCMPYSDDDDDVDWGGGSHKRQKTCCWICAVSRWDFLPQTIQDFFSAARNVYIHRLKRNLKIMAVLIIDCWFARNSATDFMSCSFIFDSLGTRQASNIKPIQSSSSKSSVANCIFLMWQNNVHEKDELAKLNAKIPRQFQLQLITFMNIELTGHNHAIPCQTKYCRAVHEDRPHLVDNIQDLLKSFLERASVPSLDWGESH